MRPGIEPCPLRTFLELSHQGYYYYYLLLKPLEPQLYSIDPLAAGAVGDGVVQGPSATGSRPGLSICGFLNA